MRKLLFVILTFVALSVACSQDSEPSKSRVLDPFGFDVTDTQVVLPPFGVVVDAGAGTVVAGQQLAVHARVTAGAEAGATYSWSLPPKGALAQGTLTSQDLVVSFDAAGEYLVEVNATSAGATVSGGVLVHVFAPGEAPALGRLNGGSLPTQDDVDALADYLDGAGVLSDGQRIAADLDLDGRISRDDLSLLQSQVSAGAAAPTHLSDTKGSALASMMAIHPFLLDHGVEASIRLTTTVAGEWDDACLASMQGKPRVDEIPMQRARPGYLSFAVPIRYSCLTSAETVRVELEAGSQTATLAEAFEIAPLPAASAEPGASVVEAMGRLRIALEGLSERSAAFGEQVGASPDESAVLQGTSQQTAKLFAENYAKFYVAFQKLDGPTRAAWEQLARAQGLDALLGDLRALTPDNTFDPAAARPQGLSIEAGEGIISAICAFNQVADVAAKVAEINDSIATALEWLDWWPINRAPVVGPVITFLSSTSSVVSAVTDMIATVAQFIPKFGDEIKIRATPASLTLGQTATLTAHLEVKIASGLCNGAGGAAVGSLIDMLKETLQRKLASMIPVASRAFRHARYQRDEMGRVVGTVYDAIGYVAGKIIDATGLEDYLSSLAEKLCGLLQDPTIPVALPDVSASCGAPNGDKWTCTEACGAYPVPAEVGLSGDKSICGEAKPAKGGVTCLGKPPAVCGDGKIEGAEQCEGATGCTSPKVCNPKCQCVEPNMCGNGIKEAGEECETVQDCGPGKACGPTSCKCEDVTCTKDADCPDNDAQDCQVPSCDLAQGTCGLKNAAYGAPCTTSLCRQDETCDVDGVCKFGNAKTCNQPPGIAACYDPGVCSELTGACSYSKKQGAACAQDSDCGTGGETCDPATCTCSGGSGGTCGCVCDVNLNCTPEPAGTTFTPVSGCDSWPDADQCSGWHSVAEGSGMDPEGQYASGTEFTGYGCTIRITCP